MKLEQTVGYLCPTLSTEHKHGLSSHCYREVATSRGAVTSLYHLFPGSGVSLGHSK